MALNAAGLNAQISGLTAVVSHVSLHTAEPNASGSSEVTGGTYSREAISWTTATLGSVESSAQIVFDVPASTTITHLGYWSAATGGTFYGSRALNAAQTYATNGTYTIAAGNIDESVS